jgi:hypothetical protein
MMMKRRHPLEIFYREIELGVESTEEWDRIAGEDKMHL